MSPTNIQSYIDNNVQDKNVPQPSMPIIHPEKLIGRTIGITQEDGQTSHLCIVEAIKEHQEHVENSTIIVQFRGIINDKAYDDILTFSQVMDYLTQNDNDDI